MQRARSLEAFQQAHAEHGGPSFLNTIAASVDGRAWYADASPVPDLAPDVLADWLRRRETDATTQAADRRGATLLDGSDSRSEWSRESGPRGPGLVPYAHSPRLERRDYVFNANDSAWVPHATARLSGYSAAFGPERTPRSLRTRMNARLLADMSPTGSAGADGKFSLDELATVAFDNRGLARFSPTSSIQIARSSPHTDWRHLATGVTRFSRRWPRPSGCWSAPACPSTWRWGRSSEPIAADARCRSTAVTASGKASRTSFTSVRTQRRLSHSRRRDGPCQAVVCSRARAIRSRAGQASSWCS